MDYNEFLKTKQILVPAAGLQVDIDTLNPMLFNFQRDIVNWALQKGRSWPFKKPF